MNLKNYDYKHFKLSNNLIGVLSLSFIFFLNISHYFSVGVQTEQTRFHLFGFPPFKISIVLYSFFILLYLKFKKINTYYIIFVFYYILFFLLSSIYSTFQMKDFNSAVSLFLLLFFSASLVLYFNNSLINFFKCVLFYTILSAVFALLLKTGIKIGGFYQPENFSRLVGWYGNPNFLATDLGLGLIISFYFFNAQKKVLNFIVFLFLLFTLILTGSKSVILILFLLIIFFILNQMFFMYKKKKVKVHYLFFFLLISVSLIIIINYLFKIDHALLSDIENIEKITTATGRIDIWSYYLNLYYKSDNLDKVFGLGRNYLTEKTLLAKSAHSFYVRAIVEHGLLYTVFVLFWLIYMLRLAFYYLKKEKNSLAYFLISIIIFCIIRNLTTPELLKLQNPLNIVLYTIFYFLLDYRTAKHSKNMLLNKVS